MKIIDKGVRALLTGSTALTALVNGVWPGMAPQGTACPFVIFEPHSDILADRTFTSDGIDARYSVKAVSHAQFPTEAQTIQAAIDAVMHSGTPAISGYTLKECRRQHYFQYPDGEGNWHAGAVYRIRAEQN